MADSFTPDEINRIKATNRFFESFNINQEPPVIAAPTYNAPKPPPPPPVIAPPQQPQTDITEPPNPKRGRPKKK